MSYIFEGKISNQHPDGWIDLKCTKCGSKIERPSMANLNIDNKQFNTYHYIGSECFIYETKSGKAVCYCSSYCLRKHNHRFTKK